MIHPKINRILLGIKMPLIQLEFGYFPKELNLCSGPVTVSTLPNLLDTVSQINALPNTKDGWIYAPMQITQGLSGDVRTQPCPSRIFGLPKTHLISHSSADNQEHVQFHIWAISFFLGIRLTTTEAGFVDATPCDPGKLVDFYSDNASLSNSIHLSEKFWVDNRRSQENSKLLISIINALFLSQNPLSLQYEQFILLYCGIDACYKLEKNLSRINKKVTHEKRIDWLCKRFGIPTPNWAAGGHSSVADIRNQTVHEAIYLGQPLGFAVYGGQNNTSNDIFIELQALLCRFIVAIIGFNSRNYVKSEIDTRQIYDLS